LLTPAASLARGQPAIKFSDRVVERIFSTHAGSDYGIVVQFLDESDVQVVVGRDDSARRTIRTMACSPSIYSQLSSAPAVATLEDAVKLIRCDTSQVDHARARAAERVIASAKSATVDISDEEFIILHGTRIRVEVRSASKSMSLSLSAPRNLERSSEPIVQWALELRRALGL
jgi:hypothetical protein